MRPFEFRSHMFRHAFIDRLKARNDIPLPLAESIPGQGRGHALCLLTSHTSILVIGPVLLRIRK